MWRIFSATIVALLSWSKVVFPLVMSGKLNLRSRRGKYPAVELYPKNSIYSLTSIQDLFDDSNTEFHRLTSIYSTNFLHKSRVSSVLTFMEKTVKLDREDIRNFVISSPEILGVSLVKKLGPRHAAIAPYLRNENGSKVLTLPLAELCKGNDQQFCENFSLNKCSFDSFKRRFLKGGLTAARQADVVVLSALMDSGWDPSTDVDRYGRTVLMWAASHGTKPNGLRCVNLLMKAALQSGEDIDTRASDGCTAFHYACEGGSLHVCQLLWVHGANPFTTDKEGTTPFMWAAGSSAPDICQWLEELKTSEVSFMWELSNSADDRADTSTSLHAQKNMFGCTAAHFAASGGSIDSLEWLKKSGADLLLPNKHGHDPLTKAIAFKQSRAAEWILINVPGAIDTLKQLRPWDDEYLSLKEIAEIVGNDSAGAILNKFT